MFRSLRHTPQSGLTASSGHYGFEDPGSIVQRERVLITVILLTESRASMSWLVARENLPKTSASSFYRRAYQSCLLGTLPHKARFDSFAATVVGDWLYIDGGSLCSNQDGILQTKPCQ